MIRAILFDSDGVLVDSERLFFDATRSAFHAAGGRLSSEQWATWYLDQGKRSREVAGLLGISPLLVEEAIAERNKLFWSRIDRGTPLFPGVEETVKDLARRFRLAVVTGASRKHYTRVHASSGIAGLFEVTVTSDDYEHGKPHPQPYLTALEKLGLKADQCLAVEDSPRGAKAAIGAGIRCLVIPTALTDIALCPAACTIMDSLAQITGFLDRLQIGP